MEKVLSKALREFMTGLHNQLLVNLSGNDGDIWEEEFKKFLRKEPCWPNSEAKISPKPSNLKLLQAGIIIPSLTESFVLKEKFQNNKKVKYWLGDNFKNHLLGNTKPFSDLSEASLDKSVLKRNTIDKDIMSEIEVSSENGLLTKEEILYRISYLTELQPKGQSGILNNDGTATIIGYFKCDDGQVRVASVYWHSGIGKWGCDVLDLGYWIEGREILSRNGILKP